MPVVATSAGKAAVPRDAPPVGRRHGPRRHAATATRPRAGPTWSSASAPTSPTSTPAAGRCSTFRAKPSSSTSTSTTTSSAAPTRPTVAHELRRAPGAGGPDPGGEGGRRHRRSQVDARARRGARRVQRSGQAAADLEHLAAALCPRLRGRQRGGRGPVSRRWRSPSTPATCSASVRPSCAPRPATSITCELHAPHGLVGLGGDRRQPGERRQAGASRSSATAPSSCARRSC